MIRSDLKIQVQIRSATEWRWVEVTPAQIAADTWARMGPDPCVAFRGPPTEEQRASAERRARAEADHRAEDFAVCLAEAAAAQDMINQGRSLAVASLGCEPEKECSENRGPYTIFVLEAQGRRASYTILASTLRAAQGVGALP